MFKHRLVAVLVFALASCLQAQALQSPDGRYRAETVRNGADLQYRVIEIKTKKEVLKKTWAQFPTPNDAKHADFSSDSTKFAVVFHYDHPPRGRHTWIGVWSTADGRFLYDRIKSGFTTSLAGVFDDDTRTPSPQTDAAPVIQTPTSATPFKKGVAYTSWRSGEYSSPLSDTTLSRVIAPMGVEWIGLLVTCYQETITSTEVMCRPDTSTPTDDDLRHVIGFSHSLGIRVMLKPHIDLSDDATHWRGQIDFGHDDRVWARWFASYGEFIRHYAALGQQTGVDLFVVGTELQGTSHRADDWRAVVKVVRSAYTGPITYAANWTEAELTWWDALDVIGVDAYYPLTGSDAPTLAALRAAWSPIVVRLSELSKKWRRRILATEIGYRSVDGSNREPYNYQMPGAVDLQEQADCYQAAFEVLAAQEWFDGFFWWNWSADPSQGGAFDSDYTANNKPAEAVLRSFYLSAHALCEPLDQLSNRALDSDSSGLMSPSAEGTAKKCL